MIEPCQLGMISFVASMCIAMPLALLPPYILQKLNLISKTHREHLSVCMSQFCARWGLRLIPFANVEIHKPIPNRKIPKSEGSTSIWVCNHTSMLDVFILLAMDKKIRGKDKRPIKILYWRGLESNPITKWIFQMSGFIPVDMADNGNGVPNDYDKKSLKTLLKNIKQAFDDGFDVGILPEGQLNPTPEKGLQPVFTGAYTISKICKNSIRFLSLKGLHQLWHPNESIGMTVTGRRVKVAAYPIPLNVKMLRYPQDFVEIFEQVVGHFAKFGKDLPNWEDFLEGNVFQKNEKKKRDRTEPR